MFQNFPEDDNNNGFLNEFRQKLADQSISSMEEKQKDMQRSKRVFLGALTGVALACVVGWFALAPKNDSFNAVEIPVVKRPQTVIKTKPTEPGGMEILNQDKTVYNIIDKSEDSKKLVENVLPTPEEPIMPEISPEVAEDTLDVEKKVIETSEVPVSPVVESETISVAKAIDQQKKKDEAVVAVAPKTAEVTKVLKGAWQVQIISSKDRVATKNSWKSLIKKHSFLEKEGYEIEEANVSGATFFRLKAGNFDTRAKADELCAKIKSSGGSCLVTQKQSS